MYLNQKVLFTKEEIHKIRGYVTKLEDRVIGTYHPDVNDGKHDPKGGHNLAEHLPWNSSTNYNWINERHAIYQRRIRGDQPPWTEDEILSKYK